jgi:two-component system response regulator FlrC
VVDGDETLRRKLSTALAREGYRVTEAVDGDQALAELSRRQFDLVFCDLNMSPQSGLQVLRHTRQHWPDTPVVLVSAEAAVEEAVEAMREGAFDFVLKPYDLESMEQLAFRALRAQRPGGLLADEGRRLERPIVTGDDGMRRLLTMAEKVSRSKATVLITGESGTGKELLARFIHSRSDRGAGPFVAVNCAALPENLLESEMFGHEKGAFTGAVARKEGRFELANGGTVLLDEISEMDLALQAKLLRVLQEGEIDRVGGRRPVPVDVRVVATSNRNLKEFVAQGRFRQDLYYRLNVIPLVIPPLRDRRGDIKLLTRHFLEKFARNSGSPVPRLGPDAERRLAGSGWPGNVRELENVIERACLLSNDGVIDSETLLFDEDADSQKTVADSASVSEFTTLKDMERAMIFKTLDDTSGNRTQAAKILGISVRTLRNKLNEYRDLEGS